MVVRLDQWLSEQPPFPSRAKAQALIMAGLVQVDGKVVTKSGFSVIPDTMTIVIEPAAAYVSRGGFKLQQALTTFGLDVTHRDCMDVGASTGGFTDCLLKAGARRVCAVDVAYGQFDWGLRQDPRVTLIERTNVRYLTPEQLPYVPQIAVVDVSFISLDKVLPALRSFVSQTIVVLVKPQFECGENRPKGFKGVVTAQADHQAILRTVSRRIQPLLPGWSLNHACFSPLKGPKGNMEFLFRLDAIPNNEPAGWLDDTVLDQLVVDAHQFFK
jgi:23S rRNA (cytidine1920-2'-O)/16S rRNA (cytidine1409-2'-O)-methyltransferase